MADPLPMTLRVYRRLSSAMVPLSPALINRRLKLGKEDPARVGERRGVSADVRPAGPLVWIHGASVGEVLAAAALIEKLRALNLRILLTSGPYALYLAGDLKRLAYDPGRGRFTLSARSNRVAFGDQSHATVVYLHTQPEDLARRLSRDTQRPLLQVADPRQRLRDLYAVRDPIYREVADIIVDTAHKSAAMLVNLISMQLDMSAGSPEDAK